MVIQKMAAYEDVSAPVCEHFQRAAEIIGKRWTTQIVRALLQDVTRYSRLKLAVTGISDNLLSERLKELESEGIVARDVTPDTPVRVDYRLTEKGRDLAGAIEALAGWAERWATATSASRG
ncbi:MAG: helix-turn-helix domain-containing protein [Actinomycetota bacterium]